MSKFQLLYHPSFTSEFNEQSSKRETCQQRKPPACRKLAENVYKININNKLCTPSSCA